MDRRLLTSEAILMIVGRVARPIYFAASEEDYIWGAGSAFIFNYRGKVFVATARHVISNPKADWRHTRIFIPNTSVALPIRGAFIPSFDSPEFKDEVEDFILLEIDAALFANRSKQCLHSWDFARWSMPGRKVLPGSEILVAGFPSNADRYDWDNRILNELMFIRTGGFAKSQLGDGMYQMEGAPSGTDFNGLSGSPIFFRSHDYIYFIGLATRGSASSGTLHFIGAEFIRSALLSKSINFKCTR